MKQEAACGIPFNIALIHPRYWLTWFGLFLAFFVAQLPNKMRHVIGRWVGNFTYNKSDKRRQIINVNLKIAFPNLNDKQRDKMTRKQLQWYGCALVDYSLLFFGSKIRLSKMLEIEGQQYIDEAINNNKSIIILLAHSVMLEFAPVALGLKYDCFGSYKTSKNAVLDWMIARSRCRHVSFVVSREEGMRKLIKSLIPKRLMIFLPDEDLGADNAVFAPFFGKEKSTLTTTARLAKMGKAVALPTFAWYDVEAQKYKIQISEPLQNYPTGDAKQDAVLLNEALEQLIKKYPEQYMWTMKWFRTRPENEATLY
ncbi:MAG: lysophospholipid acyltransferase family protein [Cocleimonas sp.]|nr:lysophospholipid acyltransferase family protein [Cocleimonas sp.]